MRKGLVILSFAFGLGLLSSQGAAAFPAAPGAIGQDATAASGLEHAQYAERRTRRGFVKCYREFIFGPYSCHTY